MQRESEREALLCAPVPLRVAAKRTFRAWFPATDPAEPGALPLTDERDWINQIHVGGALSGEEHISV